MEDHEKTKKHMTNMMNAEKRRKAEKLLEEMKKDAILKQKQHFEELRQAQARGEIPVPQLPGLESRQPSRQPSRQASLGASASMEASMEDLEEKEQTREPSYLTAGAVISAPAELTSQAEVPSVPSVSSYRNIVLFGVGLIILAYITD
jgi:hypothetical protein